MNNQTSSRAEGNACGIKEPATMCRLVTQVEDQAQVINNLLHDLRSIRRSIDGDTPEPTPDGKAQETVGVIPRLELALGYQQSTIYDLEREINLLRSLV
jgi:predicted RNase H-like nuclease (RuvC/YqgF family)